MQSGKKWSWLFCGLAVFLSAQACAQAINIKLELPRIDANPYHKPYVAVWLETGKRKPVATLAVWSERDTWLKDMRQWWRKIGRKAGAELDGVSGATRKPGVYELQWKAIDNQGNAVPPGEYLLNFEASREEGDRSYHRLKIVLGETSTHTLPATAEFGEITIVTE